MVDAMIDAILGPVEFFVGLTLGLLVGIEACARGLEKERKRNRELVDAQDEREGQR